MKPTIKKWLERQKRLFAENSLFQLLFESAKISESRITGQSEEELKKVIYS